MSTKTLKTRWQIDEHDFPYGGNSQCRYEFLLRYAALAPSGHNTQPWLFDVTHDWIDLYADPTRALPVVDPENRELIISCGVSLEFLCVSARFFGFVPQVSFEDPGNDPDFLARFSFGERRKPTQDEIDLFSAIPIRHTNRSRFDETKVPDALIKLFTEVCENFGVVFQPLTSDTDRHDIARLVTEGDRLQAADPKFRRELATWVHFNRSHSNDGMPGYAHGIGDAASVFGSLVVRTFDWGKGQAAKDEQLVLGSPLLGVLRTADDTKSSWLSTGRALTHVLLCATDHSLSASYLNQPIEVEDLRPALIKKLGGDAWPQLLLRIGYGPETKPTPRRSVDEIRRRTEA